MIYIDILHLVKYTPTPTGNEKKNKQKYFFQIVTHVTYNKNTF